MNTLVLGHESGQYIKNMIDPPAIESQGLIARFMAASTPVEVYLQQHGPLSPLELDSLTQTVKSLQTFLDMWKRREGPRGN